MAKLNEMDNKSCKNLKAMIMAAGVGSRLDPLTKYVPKPLVPVCNRPVIDILLDKLSSIGVKDVVANTYYLADQIISACKKNRYGISFDYIKEDTLSGTAGGLKKCQYFFEQGEDFIVLSADGLSDVDLQVGLDIHRKSGAIATIGIKKIPLSEVSHFGVVVTDEDGFITEFQEKPKVEEAKSSFINTGIYIFNYKIFDFIPADTFYDFAKNVFPRLLACREINTFEIKDYWTDIGTMDQYVQSMHDLFDGYCHFDHCKIEKSADGLYISESTVGTDVRLLGHSTIGKGCSIGKNVTIKDSIIWDDVVIKDNVVIENSIVASGAKINSNLSSVVIAANSVVDEPIKNSTEKLLIF